MVVASLLVIPLLIIAMLAIPLVIWKVVEIIIDALHI